MLPQSLLERFEVRLITPSDEEDPDARNFLQLLGLGGEANHQEQSANYQAKRLISVTVARCLPPPASFHLITLSARASTFGGIVRPICVAALRLTMNSNCLGCSIGKSA